MMMLFTNFLLIGVIVFLARIFYCVSYIMEGVKHEREKELAKERAEKE